MEIPDIPQHAMKDLAEAWKILQCIDFETGKKTDENPSVLALQNTYGEMEIPKVFSSLDNIVQIYYTTKGLMNKYKKEVLKVDPVLKDKKYKKSLEFICDYNKNYFNRFEDGIKYNNFKRIYNKKSKKNLNEEDEVLLSKAILESKKEYPNELLVGMNLHAIGHYNDYEKVKEKKGYKKEKDVGELRKLVKKLEKKYLYKN